MLDVPEIELDPVRPRQGRAPVDLRPTGDPRLDGQSTPLAGRVLLHLCGHCGTRPHDRHLAAQDIPQVRQLIEREASQDPADTGDPSIAALDRKSGTRELRTVHHRAQLVDLEPRAALADARLAVDRATGRLDPDCERDERHERSAQDRTGRGEQNIERALGHRHRVPSAGSQTAGVPHRSQSHRPAASDAVVST